jgi:uncharacterized protein (DUF1697 family)
MDRHIALLRGINLGATRRVAMKDLRERLEAAGYEDVRTLLQSGNVVLGAAEAGATLERDLAAVLRDAFGIDIPIVVRTRDELAEVVARDPFAGRSLDPKLYQVSFLSDEPEPTRVRALEDAVVAPEEVVVLGREVYGWHPGGIARSDLAKLITAKRLGVEVTARNWSTIAKLLDLAAG